MTKTWDVVTLGAAVGCGVVGGVFYAFSSFVMSGLRRVPAEQGIRAMQSINVTAVRPPLMLALFGTAGLCLVLGVRAVATWGDRRSLLLLVGAALYLVGAVVVTAAVNVPMNDHLAALSPTASDAASQWSAYVSHWSLANHARTLLSAAACAALALSLIASRVPQK